MIINSYVFGLDPDAQAFLTATGITDATISGAINTLVLNLKGFNLWSKMYAVYPFVGGTFIQALPAKGYLYLRLANDSIEFNRQAAERVHLPVRN